MTTQSIRSSDRSASHRVVPQDRVPITVAHGDGIGPEIMDATLRVLDAAGARIEPEIIDIGERKHLEGHSSGIAPDAWESIRRRPPRTTTRSTVTTRSRWPPPACW